jgi:hypothetical protein
VVTELGRKTVWAISSAEKGETHTLLCCVSASGQALPPFMTFPRKRMSDKRSKQAVFQEHILKKKDKQLRKKGQTCNKQVKRKGSKSETRGVCTSLPDLASTFDDKCFLSDSETDAECPLCGLTFLALVNFGCVVMAISLGLILNVLH